MDLNYQISRPNSNPDTIELSASNSQTCCNDVSASPSVAESNLENGIVSRTSKTLKDTLITTGVYSAHSFYVSSLLLRTLNE